MVHLRPLIRQTPTLERRPSCQVAKAKERYAEFLVAQEESSKLPGGPSATKYQTEKFGILMHRISDKRGQGRAGPYAPSAVNARREVDRNKGLGNPQGDKVRERRTRSCCQRWYLRPTAHDSPLNTTYQRWYPPPPTCPPHRRTGPYYRRQLPRTL